MAENAGQPEKIHWAARLRPELLERLYRADAEGIQDIDLCNNVGFRLYDRCRSFVLVCRDEVECPVCGTVFPMAQQKKKTPCPHADCDWYTTWPTYAQSVRNHYASPGRAVKAYFAFYDQYPLAKTYQEKMILIDQLIHSFHVGEETGAPAKSIASKLLEGNKKEVVRFLNRLSARDPDQKEQWRRNVAKTIDRRIVEEP